MYNRCVGLPRVIASAGETGTLKDLPWSLVLVSAEALRRTCCWELDVLVSSGGDVEEVAMRPDMLQLLKTKDI